MQGSMNRFGAVLAGLVAGLAVVGTGHAASVLTEGFDDVTTLAGKGWVQTNNSAPAGDNGWFQGTKDVFFAFEGPENSYIGANFENAAEGGAISNWLISPRIVFSGPATLQFALRLFGDDFLDTVEVYYNPDGASTDVGSTTDSTGDFALIKAFSSTVDTRWLKKSLLIGEPGTNDGRFAFRYFADDTDTAGNYIGIDSVTVTEVPEPSTYALMLAGLGLLGFAARRRRR